VSDLSGVYVYSSMSVGKCPECNTTYRIDDVVVSLGAPESNRRTLHLNCYQEAA
jgi:hypothetical protein